jgi:hypothetical protein
MKPVLTGLMLFCIAAASAQNTATTPANNLLHSKTTLQKMRAVILWDEQQHQANAPVNPNHPMHVNLYQVLTNQSLLRINYVEQRRSNLLEGLGYGLMLVKSFTRYSDSPSMNYDDLQKYYKTPPHGPLRQ